MTNTLRLVEIVAGILSGVFWLGSSFIDLPIGVPYLGGPPPGIAAQITLQARLNSIAALCAAITAIAHAVSAYRRRSL